MRAHRRHFLAVLVAAFTVALSAASASAHSAEQSSTTGSVVAWGCPSGTNWDNILQRCV